VSGNVSLYNETTQRESRETKSVLPTPTVAAVGLVAALEHVVTSAFKRPGDVVLLLGEAACRGAQALGGSEWLVRATGRLSGEAPAIDLAAEAKLQRLILELARGQLLQSAHDVAWRRRWRSAALGARTRRTAAA
jgi:phosphoribosylformylglycinamidine synthase